MNLDLVFISLLEGLTEFLPVSSTAHLIIFSKILSVDLTDPYIKFYLLAIQLGALLAGILFFAKKVFNDKKLFINICISFLPSAIIGFALYKVFKKLLEGNMFILASALLLGGIIFIYLEKVFMKRGGMHNREDFGVSKMSRVDAFIVGLAQAVAIVPGVSRSGATIIAGILRGIKKTVIIEYTFILALPTLGAAVFYDAYRSREMLLSLNSYSELGLGFLIALITAGITLYLMKKYLLKISLAVFGWYRILLFFAIILYSIIY